MLYTGVTQKTITNVCEYVYRYDIPEGIRRYIGQTVFWYGSNEPYPRRSAELLKGYLPKLEVVEFENMGHGQYLHEHSAEYAAKLIEYLKA